MPGLGQPRDDRGALRVRQRMRGNDFGRLLAAAFRDQLERVKPTPKVLEWERIAQEMRIVTEQVVRGGLAQDAAAAQLDDRVDNILAKRRWMLDQRKADAR